MDETLKLRFEARNVAFEERLTDIKQEMASRGLLNSGNTVKAGHEELVAELEGSREAMVEAFSEYLFLSKPKKVTEEFIESIVSSLNERRRFLDQFYLEKMSTVRNALQNRNSIEPYTNLDSVIKLNEQELRIAISKAVDSYTQSQGETLFHRVKNEFLNRPLVVIGVIVFSVVLGVITFVAAIREL